MTATTLHAHIEGIGLLGPGFAQWVCGEAILAGRQPYVPQKTVLSSPALLPAAERRRSGAIVRLTLATGLEAVNAAGLDAATLPTVFSSSGGDGDTCHAICEMLASSDRRLSPTRFHNSVHNAAAGYWSIATGAMAPASVLSAHDASFGAGLLEAMAQVTVDGTRCVFIAGDTSYPEPLHSARPILDAFGIALVLAPQHGPQTRAAIQVELTGEAAETLDDPAFGAAAHRHSSGARVAAAARARTRRKPLRSAGLPRPHASGSDPFAMLMPDHDWIERHIPHQGSMCLLHQVEAWDAQHIRCRAHSHRDPGNPLRAHGRLGAVCGIEYAAQAMAVHGALLAAPGGGRARSGYLISVRGAQLHVPRLDDIAADLLVDATCMTRSDNHILYQFSVSAAGQPLLAGRAAVVLDADRLDPAQGESA